MIPTTINTTPDINAIKLNIILKQLTPSLSIKDEIIAQTINIIKTNVSQCIFIIFYLNLIVIPFINPPQKHPSTISPYLSVASNPLQ